MNRLTILVRPLPGLALVAALLWGASPAWAFGAWSVVPSPNVGTGINALTGVAATSASDVWAVGDSGTGQQTLIEHCC